MDDCVAALLVGTAALTAAWTLYNMDVEWI